MKKLLTCLLIFAALMVMFQSIPFNFIKLAHGTDTSREIVNGGFETGDFTGWTTSGTAQVITQANITDISGNVTVNPHSGTYFAMLNSSDAVIGQHGLSVNLSEIGAFYCYCGSYLGYLNITVSFTDHAAHSFVKVGGYWFEWGGVDILGELEFIRDDLPPPYGQGDPTIWNTTLEGIEFRWSVYYNYRENFIDDVVLAFNAQVSSSPEINANFNVSSSTMPNTTYPSPQSLNLEPNNYTFTCLNETIDAPETHTLFEHLNSGENNNAWIYDVYWESQTFTVADTEHLVDSIKIETFADGLDPPTTLTIEIRTTDSGLPTNTTLTENTIDASGWSTSPEWHEVILPEASLSANTQYALVLHAPSGLHIVGWSSTDDNYADGSRVYSSDNGSSWAAYTPIDFMFEIWGNVSATTYTFDHWLINDSVIVEDTTCVLSITNTTTLSMVFSASPSFKPVNIVSSPEISASFFSTCDSLTHITPQNLSVNSGSYSFTCLQSEILANSSYKWTFDSWLVNGSTTIGSLSITLSITGDTNLSMVYLGSTISPFTFVNAWGATNATWYLRSDVHTVDGIFAYKLLTVNTQTPTYDYRFDSTTKNVSYGFRVFAIDIFNQSTELTSGDPVALCSLGTNTSAMITAYWTCPAYGSMIDAVEVKVYQRFNEEAWSLRRLFITKNDLLITLPSSTWTFHLYVNKLDGSTNSSMWHGSYITYNSRIDLQYYRADPWSVALARLYQQNLVGFFTTPWTYWLGDIFWSLVLFFCVVTGILKTGSLKPVLALLWILGGSGSVIWYMIPATALHVAVLMLAVAMAITFFRLIYGKRT